MPKATRQSSIARAIPSPQATDFVSLRVKLLIGFSLIFSIVFAGAFLWFYNFTTDKTISRLRKDLQSTLEGAVEGVDVDELVDLYQEGERNADGFSDDPRYKNQLAWFATVKSIEPRAWLYSFVVEGPPELDGTAPLPFEELNQVPLDQYETIWLVDLWANYPEYREERAAKFLYEDTQTSTSSVIAKYQQTLVEEKNIYKDEWGTWLSAFAPLKNDAGEVVAVLGLDIEADYVFRLQDEIRKRVLLSFVTTYGILFILIYMLSGVLTKHLTDLTRSAERIAAGNYRQPLDVARLAQPHTQGNASHHFLGRWINQARRSLRDEMNILAQAFEVMIASIQTRERMIREGKAKEDKMRRDLQVARELNALKSRFVSIVSHEFRTPLTVLRTSTELLENYGHRASEEKKATYYQRIRAAINNMTQLLEDVLVVGKSDAGKLEFKPIALDLEEFCHHITEDIQHSIGMDHTIRCLCIDRRSPQLTSDLGPAPAPLSQTSPPATSPPQTSPPETRPPEGDTIFLDPNLLRPILTNLLSNAIKYSPQDSTVTLSTELQDKYVLIEVSDQGIGIPKDDQPHLFELFHRASNVDAIRGTGLGLAIVKQCCDRHGGTIHFISQETIGTTFTVKLPTVVSPVGSSDPALPQGTTLAAVTSTPIDPSQEASQSGHAAPQHPMNQHPMNGDRSLTSVGAMDHQTTDHNHTTGAPDGSMDDRQ